MEWIPQGGSFHLPRQMEVKAMVSKGFRNLYHLVMYMFPPQNSSDLMAESLMSYEGSFLSNGVGRCFVLRHKPLLH